MSVPAEAVAAASREWVWVPETAVTVETPEYLLARMPDWFDVQLELLRLDPERPVGDVVDEVIARARELGGPEVHCWAKLHNDPSVDAAWDYARVTKRRVSIEYAMMRGINDQGWRADLLAEVLNGYGDWGWVHVNLIPLNPTPGSKWTASEPADEREFVRRLESHGIPTTVRDTRGREIDGACGQLAATES